ncbi:MAG: TIGR02117 family protein [Pseudomonadota bacterium]
MIARAFKLGFVLALAIPILFGLAAGIGGLIARNGDWRAPDPAREATVPILIGSNGVHTQIIMPARTPQHNWYNLAPLSDIASTREDFTHVAISWGEEEFFLRTESWGDLNPAIAASALAGGEGLLHIAHYVRPASSETYRTLHLRPAEYSALAAAIAQQFAAQHREQRLLGYGEQDVFYRARGRYDWINTCNQWTADQLAAAGVKTGWWVPLPGGAMQWVPRG